MGSEPRGKWTDPPADYKLKSDIHELCKAVVADLQGGSFGEFYVTFCTDMGERANKYGDRLYLSDKQKAILNKLELNMFPKGVLKIAEDKKPGVAANPVVYDMNDMDSMPF